ncbi:hypothetical protein TUM18999_46730 [Pseudomonas tohonis]|uniref:DUF7946 domain-containing protein n=1 Tax=Pseudomonas tohonis TaxID=2725477 RepID=A0A6J4E9Q8_9PSED|nr:hypothetical protein [Pseudomonas tohonis]BCG26482.1 hypothetical protein TUM18999_46730 [Pseudomonas tohonis]
MEVQKQPDIQETVFTISYDAKGDLASHTIDARDLGMAIIGMNDLITKAADIVSNGSSEADLKVVAPAKEGSLEIVFALLADPVTTVAVLKSIGIGAGAIVAGAASAIGIMDRVKDKKIDRVIIDKATNTATVYVGDEQIQTSDKVAQLVASREIRQALHNVIQAPLAGREDASIKFEAEGVTVKLDDQEIRNFTPIRADIVDKEEKREFQKVVQFTKINFRGRRGWQVLSNDGQEYGVTIRDADFLNKISSNEEQFQKDKSYTVQIEQTDITTVSGTSTRYAIVRVINEFNP